MKKIVACLVAMAMQFCSAHAMCCTIPFTEQQQKQYNELVVACRISDLRNFSSQLQAKTLDDSEFSEILKKFVADAEQVSNFVDDSRTKRLGGVDEIIVRAALCRESGSLLAGFADLLRQDEILTRINKVVSVSLIVRMNKIGLIR